MDCSPPMNGDTEKGYISIAGGHLNIIAALDGIQAATDLEIAGGEINIVTGGGSVNTSANGGGIWGGMEGNTNKPEESAKGLKASSNLTISGGTISINSADDSIHANANVTIESGNIQMASGDDGIHADETITINGGEINLTQSYEGMESAIITINGGTIHLVASDDGINAGGGADGSSTSGRPGQNNFEQSGNYYVTINGGTLFIDADGDGIDTNGSFAMTDGVVLVNGPTNNRQWSIGLHGILQHLRWIFSRRGQLRDGASAQHRLNPVFRHSKPYPQCSRLEQWFTLKPHQAKLY